MKRPFSRTAKALVTSTPLSDTRTSATLTSGGGTISTSASPPEMRSARFETTLITISPGAARASGTAAVSRRTATRTDSTRMAQSPVTAGPALHSGTLRDHLHLHCGRGRDRTVERSATSVRLDELLGLGLADAGQ